MSKSDEESYENLKNEIYLLRKYENTFFPKFHLLCKNQSSFIAFFHAPRGGNLYERLINEYPIKETVLINKKNNQRTCLFTQKIVYLS